MGIGMRTPARGVSGASSILETVQEISQPPTPAVANSNKLEEITEDGQRQMDNKDGKWENPIDTAFSKTLKSNAKQSSVDSGSDSGGKKDEMKLEMKMRPTALPNVAALRPNSVPPAVKSYTAAASRGKPSGEGITKNMIVETETVSSIPQVAVGVGAGGPGGVEIGRASCRERV